MKKGFTLIELLVVIVIIGILATLATVGLNSVRAKARDSKRISDIRQMQSALELYFNDNNGYPTNGDFVIGTPLDSPDGTKTYMAKIPSNPKPWAEGACTGSGTEYTYNYISANSYQLSYCLSNNVNDLSAGSATAMPGNINNACNKKCGSTYNKYCGDNDGCGGKCQDVPSINTGTLSCNTTTYQLYCGTTLIADAKKIDQCSGNSATCSGAAACTGSNICSTGTCKPSCTQNSDCGLCKKCSSGACVNQTSSEDLKNECTDGTGCQQNNCDGSGACSAYNDGTQHGCNSGSNCCASGCTSPSANWSWSANQNCNLSGADYGVCGSVVSSQSACGSCCYAAGKMAALFKASTYCYCGSGNAGACATVSGSYMGSATTVICP